MLFASLHANYNSKVRLIKNNLPNGLAKLVFTENKNSNEKMIHDSSFQYLYKCIFVHIPKTAGTAIINSLFDVYPENHFTLKEYNLVFKYRIDSYFKFTFVRNPWDRLFSVYNFLSNNDYGSDGDILFRQNLLKKYPEFNFFVEKWLTNNNISSNFLFYPQIFWLNGNCLNFDFVGRYESIDSDYKFLCDKFGRNPELKKIIISGNNNDYRTIYSTKSKTIVEKVYRKDIKALKYNFYNEK